MSLVIGIDFGTSYSCAAAVRDDAVYVVEDEAGRRTMPSVVHFGPHGTVEVGHDAVQWIVNDPENTIHSAKRLLGRRFGDDAVRIAQSAYLFSLVEGPNRWPLVEVGASPQAVPALCAHILKALRLKAEKYFGEPVTEAVITVPANADDAQREQTRIAGQIAGLKVLQLLNEPTSAALAYALMGAQGRTMAVYDFGGGTFDCSIIEWGQKATKVLATHGSSFLGGDDIDMALAVHVVQELQRRTGVDLRRKAAEWKRLLLACESTKRALSHRPQATIHLKEVAHTKQGPMGLKTEITRQLLARLASPFVEQTVEIMMEALGFSGLPVQELDQVLLVGGSSRLPMVREAVQGAVRKTPLIDIDPDTAVCVGAAIAAFQLKGGHAPSIERAARRPTEVLPQSLGLAAAGGLFDPVIKHNSTLPASGRRKYTTWRDDQQEMRFVVLQGEDRLSENNVRLGEFVINDLPSLPAGQVAVELLFEVDLDGLLRVSACDTTTGKTHHVRVRVADSVPNGTH